MKQLIPFILFFTIGISTSTFAQKIKTKVSEEGFSSKPEAPPEEKFEEARLFIYLGTGFGIRTGEILTGFLASDNQPEPTYFRSTEDASRFRNGVVVDFGGRYFFPQNYGIGLKSNLFINQNGFIEASNSASQKTYIAYGMLEGLYRHYFSQTEKAGFIYGALGVGIGYINQTQEYRYSRVTDVTESFFGLRPAIGVNLPIWDVIHGYGEVGYGFSQGKIADGTLSLSQFQTTIGVHIRLNAF